MNIRTIALNIKRIMKLTMQKILRLQRPQKIWRISTNKCLYNINQLCQGEKLYQSKGRAKMRLENRPRQGDLAYIAYGGWNRALCLIITDNWQNGIAHQQDRGNIGEVRKHADIEKYATLIVLNLIPEGIFELRSVQRTWTHIYNLE